MGNILERIFPIIFNFFFLLLGKNKLFKEIMLSILFLKMGL